MKGIHYNRHADYDSRGQRDEWAITDEVIVPRSLLKILPDAKVEGEIKWRCNDASEERCGGCTNCMNIKISVVAGDNDEAESVYSYTNTYPTHQMSEFRWGWSGEGAVEHWFDDEAICLKKTSDYISGSGLTADATRVVAYRRHIEVRSYRNYGGDAPPKFEAGIILAEFVNSPSKYRANWTGVAQGMSDHGIPVITEKLDELIGDMLTGGFYPEPLVCRHNPRVQVAVLCEEGEEKKKSFYLCKACRSQGVGWHEFTSRNCADVCPYFRRACKSVVEKSDKLPDWFKWSGDNLLSSSRRMTDNDCEAYEVSYVRRRDGFVRRSVLLLNNASREAWMYRYNGYIPQSLAEFRKKYFDGRQMELAEEEVIENDET